MNRSLAFFVSCAAASVVAAAALGCNQLLGIGAATQEVEDSGGGTGSDGGTGARSLSCSYYCSTIIQNCTGQFAEFVGSEDSNALCTSMCPALDQGSTIGPSNDDTLGCRIYYAEQAASDPATNCRKAGPLGGATCGSDPCQLFCELDVQYCASVDAGQYASTNACLSACEDGGFPYLAPAPDGGCTGSQYDLLDCTNTLNCRFWHLENAYGSSTSGQFHCPHTQQVSPVCR